MRHFGSSSATLVNAGRALASVRAGRAATTRSAKASDSARKKIAADSKCTGLDVRLMTALQVLQVRRGRREREENWDLSCG